MLGPVLHACWHYTDAQNRYQQIVDSYFQEMIENKEVAAQISRENFFKSQVCLLQAQ